MHLVEICKQYFEAFSKKDLERIKNMFSEDVILIDWEIYETGIEKVVEANANIFKAVNKIQVTPQNLYKDGLTIIAELEIDINKGQEKLQVVDIIKFNLDNKISKITAFKR